MGNKKNQGNRNVSQPKKDEFDVKAILHKLNKYSGGNGIPSSYEYFEDSNSEVIASRGFTNGFEQTTNKEIQNLHSKLNSDISGLKDKVYETKDSLSFKISNDIECAKKDLNSLIDNKIDSNYFYGAIAVLMLIGTLIATLSYYPMISDVNELNEKNLQLKDSINKVNSRIDKIIKK